MKPGEARSGQERPGEANRASANRAAQNNGANFQLQIAQGLEERDVGGLNSSFAEARCDFRRPGRDFRIGLGQLPRSGTALGNGANPQVQIARGLGETHARGAWPDVCFAKAGE